MNLATTKATNNENTASRKQLGGLFQIIKDIGKILSFLSGKRRAQLLVLLALQILGGFAEILSLGALLPFLSAISNAKTLLEKPEIQPLITFLNITDQKSLIICASMAFAGAFTFVNLFKIFLLWLQNRMTVALGCDVNKRFFDRLLHQDFEYHLNTNSGALISRTFVDLGAILHFIGGATMISTQSIAIAAIVSAIIYYNAAAAILIFSTTLILYFGVANLNKKQMVKNGHLVSDNRSITVHNLQIALGGIRDVLLDNKQKEFVNRYTVADRAFRKASQNTQLLSILPRHIIEIAGVTILVSVAAFYSISEEGMFGALPLIGALAMATIRILPAAQTAYNSYARMQAVHVSVERALEILEMEPKLSVPTPENAILPPHSAIDLSDVWFRFRGSGKTSATSEWILKGVNISIPVNKTVAFVGKTGSGKTTISDIVSGLLIPEKGQLHVDSTPITAQNLANWRQHVASVPQSIFLIDASVKENVAFGETPAKIDFEKVKKACVMAQIDELIQERPQQYDEVIGENGLRLSGGQRQRIGIARALYKNATVLVLDEATSALDNKTEATVMETIANLHGQQTILIIAHRLETIKKADLIFEIQEGQVVAQGTYDELLEKSESFREIALKQNKET